MNIDLGLTKYSLIDQMRRIRNNMDYRDEQEDAETPPEKVQDQNHLLKNVYNIPKI